MLILSLFIYDFKPFINKCTSINDKYFVQVNTDPMISVTGHLDVVVPPTISDEDSSPSEVIIVCLCQIRIPFMKSTKIYL